MKQSHFTIIALLLMAAVFTAATFFYNAEQSQMQNERSQQHNKALIRDHSVKAGNPAAKVTIVEFMDPACETCAQFHPFVKQLMNNHSGKINLVIRYAPFHQGSDKMVAILEAARQQDKFWQVLELMFDSQAQWASHHNPQPDLFWNVLERSGFDVARLRQDITNPAIIKVIEQDLVDGRLLGANKTPTFFVNGKPLPSFGAEQLQALVNAEISANY